MGPKFAIRDSAVTKHSSNLEQSEQSLNANASSFITAIQPLEGVWQGTSFGSWQELTSAWSEAMSGLNKALADIKGRVGNAGQIYDQANQEQTEDLSKAMASANFEGTKFNG